MYRVEAKVKKLDQGAVIPIKATEGSAYYDVSSVIEVSLRPGFVTLVPTGLAFELPNGCVLEIRPRSGLSLHKVLLANSPGILDSDYRGELKIPLLNLGNKDYLIKVGDRIAQIIIKPVPNTEFIEVKKLSSTNRGNKGLGSSGR